MHSLWTEDVTHPDSTNCPQCGGEKFYRIRKATRLACANSACRYQFTATTRTALHSRKKPLKWYAHILKLNEQGITPYQISKQMGLSDAKSVYDFLHRWNAHRASIQTETAPAIAGAAIQIARPTAEAAVNASMAFFKGFDVLHSEEDSPDEENIPYTNVLFNLVCRTTGKIFAQSTSFENCLREARWHGAVVVKDRPDKFSIVPLVRRGWGGLIARSDRHGGIWPEAKNEEFRQRYLAGAPMLALETYFDTNASYIFRKLKQLQIPRRDRPATRTAAVPVLREKKNLYRWWPSHDELMNYLLAEGMDIDEIAQHFKGPTGRLVRRLQATAEQYQNARALREAMRRRRAKRSSERAEVRAREKEIRAALAIPRDAYAHIGRNRQVDYWLPPSLVASLSKKYARWAGRGRVIPRHAELF